MRYNIGDDIIIQEGLANIVDYNNDGYKVLVNKTMEYKTLKEGQFEKVKTNKVPVSENVIKEKKVLQYSKQLQENLRPLDLRFLVMPYVSVDQYTSKINSDNITIAFFCEEKRIAEELIDFIEKMYFIELVDIELGETLTDDGKHIVYVEFERNLEFPELLLDMIDSINLLIGKKIEDWKFQTFGMDDYEELSVEAIKDKVRLTNDIDEPKDEDKKEKKKKVKETIEFSKNNLTRTYLDEGVITKEELDKYLSECELLNENALDKEILEYNLPDAEIITADDKLFVITDDIRMLGVE